MILALVPHGGAMCLLDRALTWGADRILCETARHADSLNPLRRAGVLPGVALVEPALQAMALHGALLDGDGRPQRPGFVSTLRDVEVRVADATGLPSPLRVEAVLLARGPGGFSYRFEVRDAAGAMAVSGEAVIALPPAAEGGGEAAP